MIFQDLKKLIDLFSELPGISKKSAEKYINLFIDDSQKNASILEKTGDILNLLQKCPRCHVISNKTKCDFCLQKDKQNLLIISSNLDLINLFSKVPRDYRFYVLENAKTFLKNINLIQETNLVKILKEDNINEVVFALSPSMESDLIYFQLKNFFSTRKSDFKNLIITKLGIGLPYNGSLEYVDFETFKEALNNRKE